MKSLKVLGEFLIVFIAAISTFGTLFLFLLPFRSRVHLAPFFCHPLVWVLGAVAVVLLAASIAILED